MVCPAMPSTFTVRSVARTPPDLTTAPPCLLVGAFVKPAPRPRPRVLSTFVIQSVQIQLLTTDSLLIVRSSTHQVRDELSIDLSDRQSCSSRGYPHAAGCASRDYGLEPRALQLTHDDVPCVAVRAGGRQ